MGRKKTSSNRAAGLAVTAVTAGALVLAACQPGSFPAGPEGTVVGKDRDKLSKRNYRSDLTVKTPSGQVVEFRVTGDEYDRCFHGSHYPKCANRTDR